MNDTELLERWRTGDRDAGDALFARYVDTLYRFFANKVNSQIDELVQQTISASLAHFEPGEHVNGRFRVRLLSSARRQLYAHYRGPSRTLDFGSVSASELCPLHTAPSMSHADELEGRALLDGLRRLPLELQLALELAYWEDLSEPEVAEVLGSSVDDAHIRLRTARELLSQDLRTRANRQLLSTIANLERSAAALRHTIGRGTARPERASSPLRRAPVSKPLD
jgi:RNA polymerase sigma-70 factor (ECF subfamily)